MYVMLRLAAAIGITLFLLACSQSEKPRYSLKLSEDGVGPLSAATPFTLDAIGTRLPAYDITPFTAFFQGRPSTLFRVTYHGTPWLIITPEPGTERIQSISLLSEHIEAEPYAAVGTLFTDIYGENSLQLCDNSSDYAGRLICRSPRATNIFYLFDADAGSVNKVEEILWRP